MSIRARRSNVMSRAKRVSSRRGRHAYFAPVSVLISSGPCRYVLNESGCTRSVLEMMSNWPSARIEPISTGFQV